MAGLFLRSLLGAVLLILLLHSTTTSATLTLYHGRTSNPGSYLPVEGVAVLNIGTGTSHVFDCAISDGNAANLRWEKAEGIQMFPVTTEAVTIDGVVDVMVKRLSMGMDPPYSEVGIYTCTNGDETASINITGGATAVCPVEPSKEVRLGHIVQLQVYVAGDPPIGSTEIIWSRGNGTAIITDTRVSLTDSNERLLIRNVRLEDSGMYRIDIRRQISALAFRNRATAVIDLNVHVGVTVLSSPNSIMTLEHTSVTLNCEFQGNPMPAITWEKEGSADLPVETRRTITPISVRSDNATLYTVTSSFTIRNAIYEDQGRYRCSATNTLTGEVQRSATSTFAELTVTPRLQLTAEDPNTVDENGLVSVSAGSYVEVQCSGSGELTWVSSSGAAVMESNAVNPSFNVFQTHDPTRVPRVQRLVIQTFSPADIALYTCTTDLIVNGISFTESVYISSSDPVIYIPDETIYAPENSGTQIRATVYSSDLNSLTVLWYHESTLIDTISDPRYSVSAEGMNLHILNIARVELAVLGRYMAVVTAGNMNRTDVVQLAFPDSPSASVVPMSHSVAEGESATFECEASGTEPIVVWSLFENQPLPSGVVQSGTDLVIAEASQDNAGLYLCTVSNGAGATTSTATLTVFYPPAAVITREGTTESSVNQVLKVVAEEGDSAPTFTCSADGSPPPILSWGGQNGGVALPREVSLVTNRQNMGLAWHRPLEYTDSGNYTCNAMNSAGSSSVTLDLLVKHPPTITTVFPTLPVNFSSDSSTLLVPLGYRGTVVTCAARGWPTPTIEWERSTRNLSSRMVSDSAQNPNPAFVSARLRWIDNDGFLESDAGDYTCVVRASDTDAVSSKVITLEIRTDPPPTETPMTCSVSSEETNFQVRVLDTNCLIWPEELKMEFARTFMDEVVNAVSAACQECVITSENIVVAGTPTCSQQVEGAAVFRGTVSTESLGRTQNIFCALSRWQQSGPLVWIDSDFHLVDRGCPAELRSPGAVECTLQLSESSFPLIIVSAAAAGGGALAILLVVICICCCCCCCACKASGRKSDELKITPGTSQYERTHHCDGNINLMRYTDSINPETPTSLSSPANHENVYSTLNHAEMSLPPPPPFNPNPENFEMDPLRKDSCVPLLPGDMVDREEFAHQPFQLMQGGTPEPYQVAINSQDNLCNVGVTEGGQRHTASQRVLNSRRYETDHPVRHLTHTLSSGAVPAQRGIGSGITAPYEQVDRKYGVNEYSAKTSPKLQARAGTMPSRVASSGHIMRGMPPVVALQPVGFRRHQSSVENSGRSSGTSSDSDYSHLNRGGDQRGPLPPPLTITHRGGRMASVSSMPTSTPTGHQTHQLPRVDKRHSITNYTRGSTSPSDTLEVMKSPLNFTPTSEASPPYRASSTSSPYTPSGSSSLLGNGAFEGLNHTPGAHSTREGSVASDTQIGVKEMEEQKPWYQHGSDFSIEHEPPADVGEVGVISYPRGGSNEIEGRRMSSRVIDSRGAQLPVSSGVQFPYGGSRLPHPQPANAHFRTVVV